MRTGDGWTRHSAPARRRLGSCGAKFGDTRAGERRRRCPLEQRPLHREQPAVWAIATAPVRSEMRIVGRSKPARRDGVPKGPIILRVPFSVGHGPVGQGLAQIGAAVMTAVTRDRCRIPGSCVRLGEQRSVRVRELQE
jgi:hypothetical protein